MNKRTHDLIVHVPLTYEDPFGKIFGDRITRSQSQDRGRALSSIPSSDYRLLLNVYILAGTTLFSSQALSVANVAVASKTTRA